LLKSLLASRVSTWIWTITGSSWTDYRWFDDRTDVAALSIAHRSPRTPPLARNAGIRASALLAASSGAPSLALAAATPPPHKACPLCLTLAPPRYLPRRARNTASQHAHLRVASSRQHTIPHTSLAALARIAPRDARLALARYSGTLLRSLRSNPPLRAPPLFITPFNAPLRLRMLSARTRAPARARTTAASSPARCLLARAPCSFFYRYLIDCNYFIRFAF